jgi:hypothetical protein
MNFTNDSGENDNDKNSSSDEDEDNDENTYPTSSSIYVEKFFSDNNNDELDSNDDDDDESDIENHYSPVKQFSRQNRLCTLLRQSNHLVELKLNIFHNRSSLRPAISDSDDISKQNDQQGNPIYYSSTRIRRLYLPSSSLYELQTQITNWLQASTCLIDSISTSTYHRRCWSQLLLTYFIERRFVNLQFILCTHSLSLTTVDQNSCSMHQYACIPEEDAYKLCSILQKGSKFNIDSNIFDHIRRIIVIKSMQEGKKLK